MEGFYRQRGKERKGYLIFLWGMERADVAGYLYLIYVDQKIPDWPVKIAFLGKVEIATRLDIKRCFGSIGLAQVTAFWASIFFLTTRICLTGFMIILSALT